MSADQLVILHLSDIHFYSLARGDDLLDYDTDVRNELERDAVRLRRELGDITAILISGDIAFGGKPAEYAKARQWLESLCGKLGCSPSVVWTTPGNHDVDRATVDGSPTIRKFHDTLRDTAPEEVDGVIRNLMQDPVFRESLFKPMEAYNQFATPFECTVSADAPFWQHDLPLNDGSTLRMCGLTSTLVSDRFDNTDANRLVIGQMQLGLQRTDGVEYLTATHHPPDWLLDGENVSRRLNARARIQLFGHKHELQVEHIGDSVRVVAGAVHPERGVAPWEPRYNYLTVRVEIETHGRVLRVGVWPRMWDRASNALQFGPDPSDGDAHERSFLLPIQDWLPPRIAVPAVPAGGQEVVTPVVSAPIQALGANPPHVVATGETVHPRVLGRREQLEANRKLAYAFLTLGYQDQIAIAQSLGLVADEDRAVDELTLFRAYVSRALVQRKLQQLWEAVRQRSTGLLDADNPFAGR